MKLRVIAGCVFVAVLLYGCASPGAPSTGSPYVAPTDTSSGAPLISDESTLPPATIATGGTDAEATDALFAILVKARVPKLQGATDAKVIELGRGICEEYDAGQTTTQIGTEIVASGLMDLPDAGYVIGVSTDSYCPQHNAG